MNTSPLTPRTDAMYADFALPNNTGDSWSETLRAVDFARTLERENARLRTLLQAHVDVLTGIDARDKSRIYPREITERARAALVAA